MELRTATGVLFVVLQLLFFFAVGTSVAPSASDERSTYIVHMAKSAMPAAFAHHSGWYEASLSYVAGEVVKPIYYYDTVVHGFSARLTGAEADALSAQPGVVSVNPEIVYRLHTTRTPEFLGLDGIEDLFPHSGTGGDVVVGVLDTGVWPESKSYDDSGFGPTPASWKGVCQEGSDFNSTACNRKLIGARYFSGGYEASMGPIDQTKESRSPRDTDGHGTHTSSTAAGASVPEATLFGYASGTARGMAPKARVAVYKVCWRGGCFSSDILAAMDAAVADGCHVLSLSLGGGSADYYRDSIAIGAFTAMEKGVLISCSAGNAGPSSSTLSNVAPWITTVGAGTLDRNFPVTVTLGDGKNYTGASLYSGAPLPDALLPIIYAGNATNTTNGNLCMPNTLIPEKVAGKIVLCDRGVNARVEKGYVVRTAGGAGMVLANMPSNGEELVADSHLLPAVAVGQKAGDAIKAYLSSDSASTATISFAGTQVGVKPAPVMAAFSSRGPNSVTPEILKPDVIAPGVNILAAWTGSLGPTGLAVDTRRTAYNIISGTSMSCPHVSGLAALIRQTYPDWSPAAIRSALMTTAYSTYNGTSAGILDVTGVAATPLDYGAGHVDPARAVDPGLIYDLTADDYVDFLCAINYTPFQIAVVSKRTNHTCGGGHAVSQLNYPSFAVAFRTSNGDNGGTVTATHTRTLTNVGSAGTYKASTSSTITGGGQVNITVDPTELTFAKAGEKKTYQVKFAAASLPSGSAGFGRIVWTDGAHQVASPITFAWT